MSNIAMAKLFEQAAINVETGSDCTCCGALWGLTGNYRHNEPSCRFLRAVLKPRTANNNDYWYGDTSSENRHARVMGLMLCALLLRDGFTTRDFPVRRR